MSDSVLDVYWRLVLGVLGRVGVPHSVEVDVGARVVDVAWLIDEGEDEVYLLVQGGFLVVGSWVREPVECGRVGLEDPGVVEKVVGLLGGLGVGCVD